MGLGFEVWVIISQERAHYTAADTARRRAAQARSGQARPGQRIKCGKEGVAMAEVNAFRLFR